MSINKDIPELLNAGVISEQTADKIRGYYKSKDIAPPKTSALNYRLMVVFGILGLKHQPVSKILFQNLGGYSEKRDLGTHRLQLAAARRSQPQPAAASGS